MTLICRGIFFLVWCALFSLLNLSLSKPGKFYILLSKKSNPRSMPEDVTLQTLGNNIGHWLAEQSKAKHVWKIRISKNWHKNKEESFYRRRNVSAIYFISYSVAALKNVRFTAASKSIWNRHIWECLVSTITMYPFLDFLLWWWRWLVYAQYQKCHLALLQ